MVRFGILGSIELSDGERRLSVGGPRQLALVAFLLLHANRAVSSDALIDALWSDQSATGASKRLQVAIARLRKALAPFGQMLRTVGGGYLLQAGASDLDSQVFEAGLEEGRRLLAAGETSRAAELLGAALGLWRGPALADVAFEDFAQAEIRRLEDLRLIALETHLGAVLELGRHAEVVAEARRLAGEHPLRERLQANAMLALYRCGRQAEALDLYREARRRFAEELGVDPGPELRELERAILNQDAELDGPSAGARVLALPARTMMLFGREGDLSALADLVARARLITLTGPGGVGKTSLALEAARRLVPRFPDGGRWVELAAVSDPAHVAAAMTQALGIEIRDTEMAAQALARSLAERRLLLVLDNLEHLLDAAPLVTELLHASPGLVVVCTSRAPLQLSAEHLYPVAPLPTPAGDVPDEAASVAMFCDRARARDPAFAITEGNARAVATICRRLDGLPLALELAAARLGFLSPDELVAGLDDALGLLVGGARDAPDRQRTLRATLDWSHRLVSADERRAFARFAVFAGGATLQAALEVTEAELATLEALTAQHLLAKTGDRLGMLEPIREYAAEQLGGRADAVDVRRRHALYYQRLADAVGPELDRAGRRADLAMFVAEADNLRAAIAFALAQRDSGLALDLVSACAPWWRETNQTAEGRDSVQATFALAGETAPMRSRARALGARATLWARTPGAIQRQRADLLASLELSQKLGDTPRQIQCLTWLSDVEHSAGLRKQAAAHADQAIALARRTGHDAMIARAHALRAALEPDLSDAARRVLAVLPSLLQGDELAGAFRVLIDAGYVALADGRLDDAQTLLENAAAVADALATPRPLFTVHGNLGLVHLFRGHDAAAADALRRSLEAARTAQIEEIDEALYALAALAARHGDLEQAAQLAGAARAHVPATLYPSEREVQDLLQGEYLSPARRRLGEQRWDQMAAQGAALGRLAATELGLAAATRQGPITELDADLCQAIPVRHSLAPSKSP